MRQGILLILEKWIQKIVTWISTGIVIHTIFHNYKPTKVLKVHMVFQQTHGHWKHSAWQPKSGEQILKSLLLFLFFHLCSEIILTNKKKVLSLYQMCPALKHSTELIFRNYRINVYCLIELSLVLSLILPIEIHHEQMISQEK